MLLSLVVWEGFFIFLGIFFIFIPPPARSRITPSMFESHQLALKIWEGRIQRRELPNGGGRSLDEPLHRLAGLVIPKSVLQIVELDCCGDGKADPPIPKPLGGEHLAVAVFPTRSPGHPADPGSVVLPRSEPRLAGVPIPVVIPYLPALLLLLLLLLMLLVLGRLVANPVANPAPLAQLHLFHLHPEDLLMPPRPWILNLTTGREPGNRCEREEGEGGGKEASGSEGRRRLLSVGTDTAADAVGPASDTVRFAAASAVLFLLH